MSGISHFDASLPELKQKARSAGVSRLPRSYELLLKEENNDSDGIASSDTSETKSKKKLSQDTRSSRRTRMMSTLAEVCKKTPKSAKGSECNGQSPESLERIQKNDFKSPARVEQIQKSPFKCAKSPSRLEHIQKTPLTEKVSPFKMAKPCKPSTPKTSDRERYLSVTEQDESKLPPTLSTESSAKKMKLDDSLDSTMEYDDDDDDDVTNMLDYIDQGEDFQNKNKDDDENEEKNSREMIKDCGSPRSDFGSDSGSEDATAKLCEDYRQLQSELKDKNLQIVSLRAGLRMSEDDRLQLRRKNQTLEETVTELRKELEHTRTLQDDNKKLTRLVKTAGDLLVSGLQKFGGQMTAHSTPKTQVARDNVISHSVVKHLDFSALPNKSSKPILFHRFTFTPSPKKSKSHLPPLSSAAKVSSKISKRSRSPKDDFDSAAKNAKKSESTEDASEVPLKKPKKSESPSTSKEGLSHKDIVTISEAVRDDLSGNKSLEVDENKRICIGKHIRISQQKWSVIKAQPKISLFIKKLADSAYGRDALKVRVVGEPKGTSPKQQATPMKVDTFVAALRGRLLFEQPNHPNVDAAAAAARTLLATKMQDEARHKSKKE